MVKNIVGAVFISLGLWVFASFFLYLNLFNQNQPDCSFAPDFQTWYNQSTPEPSSDTFGPNFYPQYIFDGLSWKCPEKQIIYVDLFAVGASLIIIGIIALKINNKKGTHL
jgi:hypothetical protein